MINTTNTEGWFIRVEYWNDSDTHDRNERGEASARKAAREASLELKADISVCHGATVKAVYRNGEDIIDQILAAEGA